ncbi:DUF6193 family natural product biosynthesis protein [Kitasatospora sp. NPDC056651]|uniref:DUF6193 family natural product biosynthesis protein n=1 Tax=Kitasatospora sp. NPDC056651 TaxID=3345892 RepID=UPI0036D0B16C
MNSGSGKRKWDEDGALRAALRDTAEELGLVLPESDGQWGCLAEYLGAGNGLRAVVSPPGNGRRTFDVRLQLNRTPVAGGGTSDLAKAARAVAAWTGGAGLEETRARASCIKYRPWALAHEREPFGKVELTWLVKLDRIHSAPFSRHPRAHEVLAAAYAQPVLRGLMPVNSHYNLWFSTTIEEFWKTHVGYVLCPYDEGLYGVRSRGELIARTETAEEAVALVAAALPEGIGPAS